MLRTRREERLSGEIGNPGPLGRLLVRGEPGWHIIPELAPQPNEPIVDKPGFSSFYATDLEHLLVARGIRHLMVCGVTADVCVHPAVRDMTERAYEPLRIEDCCAATIAANHAPAINTIRSEGGIFGATTATSTAIATIARMLASETRC